jgi:hypothetical protein
MSLAIDNATKFTAATRVVEQMKDRTRRWAQKATPADKPKVKQRAEEIVTIETALLTAMKGYQPIIISETEEDAYRRGLEAGQRLHGPHHHGFIDRRRVEYDNFGSPYNPANEARRKAHNALQAKKWADHY